MNKQEVIDKQALIDELMKIPGVGSNSDALKTIKRFPSYEPQKVKVPAFVAEYIEKLKNTNSRYGVELEKAYHDEENSDLANWLWFNKNTLTLFKALENGYEVEEEPKWLVADGNGKYFCKFTGEGIGVLWVSTNIIPYMFEEKEKAAAVATLTGGTVEKV